MSLNWKNLLLDFSFITFIIAIGCFMVIHYFHGEYINTGYEDWMYHAFRIKDIREHGISSWGNLFANGNNYWITYQYFPHLITLGVSQLTGISIARAMISVTIFSLVFLRVITYIILRSFKVSPLYSLIAALVSYTFIHQWRTVSDFSLMISFTLLPIFIFTWIKSFSNQYSVYISVAMAGYFWSIHPILGYSTSALLVFLFLSKGYLRNIKILSMSFLIYLFCSISFFIPYFFTGDSITNPFFNTKEFFFVSTYTYYFGFSLPYFILFIFTWIVTIIRNKEMPQWSRLLLLYSTLYLLLIYLGLQDFLPEIIKKLQISRGIPFIAISLSFCFGVALDIFFKNQKSKFLLTMMVIVISLLCLNIIHFSTRFSPNTLSKFMDPVAEFFKEKDISLLQGSVYTPNVSMASFFAPSGIRYATSYFEHIQPHPYSVRMNKLLKNSIFYTGISQQQIQSIYDYSNVLGVEYFFIPNLSPLPTFLNEYKSTGFKTFEKLEDINVSYYVYTPVHNPNPIHYAYLIPKDFVTELLYDQSLKKPTMQATSYTPWDQNIAKISARINDKTLVPLKLTFVKRNSLSIDIPSDVISEKYDLFIVQSYDNNWQGNVPFIQRTTQGLIHIVNNNSLPSQITLTNTWPSWHWPVQYLSFFVFLLVLFFSVLIILLVKLKQKK